MATKRRRDDSSSETSSSETSSSSKSSETSSSSSSKSSTSRRRRNKKSRTTTTTLRKEEKRRGRKRERDGDDFVEGLTNAKLLDARKKLLKKIRDFERAHERAKDIMSRVKERSSGSHHHHREEEEENARPHQREYDGPMDRDRAAMMMPATNEWTREKEERAREKVEKKVFAPPPAPKRRKVGENAKDEEAEEGEVKKEQKKFVPPPGEMTMKAAPYLPPPKLKAAKTWKRPPVVPNRNKVEGPKIPEIGKSGFTRQRSVSPGIHAKDLAPWTMSAHAKKPTTEEEEEEEADKEKPKNVPPAPARTRATRSASPSPVLPKPIPAAPESRRRSSRRSKSASVEPVDPSTLGEKEQRPPTRRKAAAAAAASALTVRELKDILAKKGLRTDGLKADLVERVASLEENY